MKIEKILFPTDFSTGSEHAFAYAADMARKYGARLFVVHVFYDIIRTTEWYVPDLPLENLDKDMAESAERQLNAFCDKLDCGGAEVERKVLRGTPFREIVRYAEENAVDLIVIGTHGRTGIDRVLFGSTAEQVVRRAGCPVLSVRLPSHRATG